MHELRKKLNNLKKVQPDAAWQAKQWSLLLSKINEAKQVEKFNWGQKIAFLFSHPMLFRPLGNIAVVILVLAAGSWAAVASVQNSMPNHFLYPAKITLEKVELALTADNQAKVSKQASLAQKRVGELQYLMATAEMPIDSLPVNKTVRSIKENLQEAQENLSRLNIEIDSSGNFTKMAEEVEKSASQISRSLKETSAKLPAEMQVSVSQELKNTAEEVSDIGAQAFDLLIRNWLTDDQVPEEKIQKKIEEKVSELNKTYRDLDVETWLEDNATEDNADDMPEEVLVKVKDLNDKVLNDFAEIENKMAEKDYLGVLKFIDDIRQNINGIENIISGNFVLGQEEEVETSSHSPVIDSDSEDDQSVQIQARESADNGVNDTEAESTTVQK